jgi:hypothetical protein
MVACFAFFAMVTTAGMVDVRSVRNSRLPTPFGAMSATGPEAAVQKNSQPGQQGLDLEISPVVHI